MSDESNLPPGWAQAAIGEVSEKRVPKVTPEGDGKFTYVDIASIDNVSKTITSPKVLANADAPSRARQSIKTNDILVSMTRPNLNAVAIVSRDLDGSIASTGFDVLRAKEVDPAWVFARVRSPEFVKEMTGLVQGALYPAVKSADVRNHRLPLPPLNEQRRIVTKIEALQACSQSAHTALKSIPPLFEKFRQSVLTAAFRGDLTADWRAQNPGAEPASELLRRIRTDRRARWEAAELAKMKAKGKDPKNDKWKERYKEPINIVQSKLPKLPPGWVWSSVEALSLISSGQTPKGIDKLSTENGEIPWFRVGDMNSPGNEYEMLKAEVNLSDSSAASIGLHIRPKGTILFPKRGGAIATNKKRRLGRDGGYDLNIMGLVPIEPAGDYLWAWIQSLDLGQLGDGGVIPQINHGDIAPLAVPLPPLFEQQQIVNTVSNAISRGKALSEHAEENANYLERLDRSVLAKAFRGELVPQDSADEPASILLGRILSVSSSGNQKGTSQKSSRKRKVAKKKTKVTVTEADSGLLTVLRSVSEPVTAEWLFAEAGFTPDHIDQFYAQLKLAVDRGEAIEQGDRIKATAQ